MPPKTSEKESLNPFRYSATAAASAAEADVQPMDSGKYDPDHLHLLFSGYDLCPMSHLEGGVSEQKRKLYVQYSDATSSLFYSVLDPAFQLQKGEISLQALGLPPAGAPVLSESAGFPGLAHFKEKILDVLSRKKHIIASSPFNHASFCSIQGKEITLLIGNTGAGKSTLINYLMGCKMHLKHDFLEGAKLEMEGIVHARIGCTSTSQTLFPEFFTPNGQEFYADCAGFGENRGVEEGICASVSVRAAINMSKNVKAILLVVDYSSFKTDRAAGIRRLIDNLYKFLPDIDKVGPDLDLKSSIALIVTKLPPQVEKSDLCLKLQNIVAEILEEKQKAYDRLKVSVSEKLAMPHHGLSPESEDMKNLDEHASFLRMLNFVGFLVGLSKVEAGMPRSLIVGNIFDEGSTRKEIQAFIRASSVIPKSCFNVRDDVRCNQFNHFLTDLIERNISILERHNRLCREIQALQKQINADRFERDKTLADTNLTLASHQKELGDVKKELAHKSPVISLIARLYEGMGSLLIERSCADKFMSAHAEYLSLSDSVVKRVEEQKPKKEENDSLPSYAAHRLFKAASSDRKDQENARLHGEQRPQSQAQQARRIVPLDPAPARKIEETSAGRGGLRQVPRPCPSVAQNKHEPELSELQKALARRRAIADGGAGQNNPAIVR
jgi:energy-coupling factor transporter ATP-binding protein EcfA2